MKQKKTLEEKRLENAIRTLQQYEAWEVFYKGLLINTMVRQSNLVMNPIEDLGSLFGSERAKGGLMQLQNLVRYIDGIPERETEDGEDVG